MGLNSVINMPNSCLLFAFRMRLLFIFIDINAKKSYWCKLIDQNGMNFVLARPIKFLNFFQVISQNNEHDLWPKTIYNDLSTDNWWDSPLIMLKAGWNPYYLQSNLLPTQ